ncbi:hypothetical protein EJ997_01955 [Flaviflexus ciconiae]|uniref:Tetratricopeptide repeat protein n=1 Tax=Flaviflexus ciconiae TaxID=2496867 RepID=A0A3Q9G699_9ACTO|nr:hypothetical protein [Flaviflexus ciconiae]AZQ76285.1 hypothetical protein EJ997_01955 [Flaviflexus ciconiae]
MAFIDLLRQLMQVSGSADEAASADVARAIELRETLSENPNDIAAFQGLAELVDHAASSSTTLEDPLTADQEEAGPQEQANLAMWSLAEELSGRPNAWYPLIELARLSVDSDIEGATRRLQTAVERDETGRALGESIKVLREAGYAESGISLGIGHWDPENQKFAAGEQLILAAIDAERPDIASRNFDILQQHAIRGEHEDRLAFLARLIEESQAAAEAKYKEREKREN